MAAARAPIGLESFASLEASRCALETVHGLPQAPRDHAHVVIAIAQDVIARGKTVLRAFRFHLVELLHIELVIANHAPIMRR